MLRFLKRIALPMVLLPLVAVACDDGTSSQQTDLSLLLTDDRGDHVDNVWIEIEEIYLQGTGGRQVLLGTSEADGLGLIELTELDDETLALVEDQRVPSGSYGQLRFVVASAVLEADGSFYSFNGAVPPTEDPATFEADGDLICPSCAETGIKALLPQDELPVEGDQKIIVLDFDVARSFGRVAGMSGQWVMTPIIIGTDLGFTGGVTGTVSLADGVTIPNCPADPATEWDITVFEATATAGSLTDEAGEPVVYSAHPDADGNLAFEFLSPDAYEMGLTDPLAVTDDVQLDFTVTVEPTSVDVTSSDQAQVSYTIDDVTCEQIPS